MIRLSDSRRDSVRTGAHPPQRHFRISILTAFLLALISGCSSDLDYGSTSDNASSKNTSSKNTSSESKSPQPTRFRKARGVTTGHVLSKLKERGDESLRLGNELCAIVESVTDDASGRDAVNRLRTLNGELAGSIGSSKTLSVEASEEDYAEMQRGIDRINKDVAQKMQQLFHRLENAAVKLRDSQVSHHVKQEVATQLGTFSTQSQALDGGMRVSRIYPANESVTVIVERPELSRSLMKLCKKDEFEQSSSSQNSTTSRANFAPCKDLQEFADSISVGTVTSVDHERREIHLELTDAEAASLEKTTRESLAAEIQERRKSANADAEKIKNAAMKRMDAKAQAFQQKRMEKAMVKRKEALNAMPERLQSIKDYYTAKVAIESIRDSVESYQRTLIGVGNVEIPADQQSEDDELLKKVDEELTRLNKNSIFRVMLAKEFGSQSNAKRMLEKKPPTRGYTNPAKYPNHADFLVGNLVDIETGGTFERKEALERLEEVDPSKVDNRSIRKGIARALRDLAIEEGGGGPNEALRPLIKWGGPQSAPILAKLLSRDLWPDDAKLILRMLGDNPSPEGAKAVAKLVGDFRMNEAACRTLVNMGNVAESAVIKIAPSNDPDVSLAAVMVLGEIGSKESVRLLRQARTNPNPQIKMAAAAAVKKISQRIKQEKSQAE